MPDVSLWTLVFLVIAAFSAGWIDAVVGGGGLIQLPAMLLGLPNASPAQILSTNKISSLCGTATSAVTFGVKVRPDRRTVLPLAFLAGLGSAAGALVATKIPMSWFKPIVLVLLIGVAIYTAMKPSLGARTALRFDGRDHYVAASVVGVLIGFYDGAVGPGTGSFLIFALVGFLGYNFLQASAKAKIANVATNLGAIIIFAAPRRPALDPRPDHGRRQHARRPARRPHRGGPRQPLRPHHLPGRRLRPHPPPGVRRLLG